MRAPFRRIHYIRVMNSPLSGVQIAFNPETLLSLNLSLAFIMFGVAISLDLKSFKEIWKSPKAIGAGVVSQFILLPTLTFIFVWITNPLPGLALGMMLVAACPGGNVSNFFSMEARGNVALSVCLTAIATVLASFMTPINLAFWAGMLPFTSSLLRAIEIDFLELAKTVSLILVLPLVTGVFTAKFFPALVKKISKPVNRLSLLILAAIIVIAFTKNYEIFLQYYHYVVYLVLLHNALALASGYFFGKLVGAGETNSRTISIETGIQNSGLGLVIIFNFFDGLGGMAIITAWWGIWHLISGFIVSQLFSWQHRKMMASKSLAE